MCHGDHPTNRDLEVGMVGKYFGILGVKDLPNNLIFFGLIIYPKIALILRFNYFL